MKANHYSIIFAALAVLFSPACSVPGQVQDLARQTRAAQSQMAQAHEQDLRDLAEYDRQRVVQFNRLLSDYTALRLQVLDAFNLALNHAKSQALAELDHEYDLEAERIMTNVFWSELRVQSDNFIQPYVTQRADSLLAKSTAAALYPTQEAIVQSFLEARRQYEESSDIFKNVEGCFNNMVMEIEKGRAEFHQTCQTDLDKVTALTLQELPGGIANFTLEDDSKAINQRVADLQAAYIELDKAEGETVRFLEDYNPGKTFIEGVAGGALSSGVGSLLGKDVLPVSPAPEKSGADTSPSVSNLGDIMGPVFTKLTAITGQKAQADIQLPSTVTNVLSKIQLLIKALAPPPTAGADTAVTTAKPASPATPTPTTNPVSP